MNFNLSAVIPLAIGLLLFGILYALIVYKLGDRHHGYTSLLVAFGVAVTIAGTIPVIGIVNALIVFAAFALTGAPMITGDAIKGARERQAREAAQYDLLSRLTDRGIEEADEVKNAETPPAR